VTVGNNKLNGIQPQSRSKEFYTGAEPVFELFTVSPPEGLMYNTKFSITLGGYDYSDDKKLSYILYGTTKDGA